MIVPLDTLLAITLALALRERDVAEVLSTERGDDVTAWAARMAAMPGERWAMIDATGFPVAMGGALPLWPTVMQTWLVASDELPHHGRELLRFVKELHKALAKSGVRRFQTYCLVGYETGHRFLHHLGYEHEGCARGMGKRGEDFNLMARIEREAA